MSLEETGLGESSEMAQLFDLSQYLAPKLNPCDCVCLQLFLKILDLYFSKKLLNNAKLQYGKR